VAWAKRGQEPAFRELVRRYERPVFSLLYRMVRDRALAEDLAQETFVKVLNGIKSYRPEFKFSSWIFKIANNAAIDHFRRRSLRTLSLDGSPMAVSAEEAEATALQLVGDGIRLLDSGKDKWIDIEGVKEKFGVEPDKVVEVMGLMGDAADNIPGVRGIGEKTASALIQRYQSIENLYDHLHDLEATGLRGVERIRKALAAGKDQAFLSRELATVRADVPIRVELEQLHFRGWDKQKLQEFFTEMGFTQLLKVVDNNSTEGPF